MRDMLVGLLAIGIGLCVCLRGWLALRMRQPVRPATAQG